MTPDEALALYNAGPKVATKILCDLSNTVQSQAKSASRTVSLGSFSRLNSLKSR